MTVGSKPPVQGEDHCLKPPDGSPQESLQQKGSPTGTPVQPSKKAKAQSSSAFSGQVDMDVAIVTARAADEEMLSPEQPEKGRPFSNPDVNQESAARKISYKDSFLRNGAPLEILEGDYLMLDESDDENGEDDPECPTIRIKKRTNAIICNRWRRAITFRVLGKNFPFVFVHRRVQRMWAKTGGMKVGDIGNGYFQASFDSQLDHDRALYGGPWTIEDHYIVAEPWRLDFDTINRTVVWVRLPRLPLAYFDEDILTDIWNMLGRVEKIDYNTANGFRGNYARICVEIDLRKKLVSKYRIKRRVRRVEYEGLHIVCYDCGMYGHLAEACPQRKPAEKISIEDQAKTPNTSQASQEIRPEILEDYGPRMLATRPKMRNIQQQNRKSEDKKKETVAAVETKASGSRFSALEAEEMEIQET
ncbi:unnamed protein product [Linum trigynum]|uniref:CCHC-type domain-containing protein n=1 Tax=Linum trigynum TaxID=586398 RepID=A0AAV2CST7_9ROSI